MKKYYLLTAFGKDRPGIVSAVTKVLFDLGGNIEDASMTRLGGEFTMMWVAGLPPAVSSSRLLKAFSSLRRKVGLDIEAKPITPALARGGKNDEPQYLISVYGADKPGIVYRVTEALAKRRVSITDLNTRAIPRSGVPTYVMILEVRIPDGADLDDLRSALEELRISLQVEISFQDFNATSL